MPDYDISENPVYSAEIRKLEDEDPISATKVFNPLIERMIENTAAVRKEAGEKAKADLSNVSAEALSGLTVGNAGTVGGKTAEELQDYNGLSNKPVIPVAVSTKSFTATLTVGGWSSEAPYTQTVAVVGLLVTDNPVADVVQSNVVDAARQELESWAMVSRLDTGDGSITAYCYEEKPLVDLPIGMEVVR